MGTGLFLDWVVKMNKIIVLSVIIYSSKHREIPVVIGAGMFVL